MYLYIHTYLHIFRLLPLRIASNTVNVIYYVAMRLGAP